MSIEALCTEVSEACTHLTIGVDASNTAAEIQQHIGSQVNELADRLERTLTTAGRIGKDIRELTTCVAHISNTYSEGSHALMGLMQDSDSQLHPAAQAAQRAADAVGGAEPLYVVTGGAQDEVRTIGAIILGLVDRLRAVQGAIEATETRLSEGRDHACMATQSAAQYVITLSEAAA
jgi:hypothetical protein